MVVAPAPDGVKVAVYTVDDTVAKLLNEPPVTVISFAAKPVAASLAVNLRAIVESFVVHHFRVCLLIARLRKRLESTYEKSLYH